MSAPRQFGVTWWGRAWLDALEQGGSGYQSRLPAGRSFARRGQVHDFEIRPGHITARVVERSGELLRVDIAVRTLAPDEQTQVAEAIASRAGHLAALLDGELLPEVIADAASVDVAVVPTASDLRPDCACDDWTEPCRHAAAVCYVVAAELDRDPFLMFLLRGVARDDLLGAVRAARTAGADRALGADVGDGVDQTDDAEDQGDPTTVDAAEVWAQHPGGSPAPEALRVRPAALATGVPRRRAWRSELPTRAGVDPTAVDDLVYDAAVRAWLMLADGAPSMLQLSPRADLARRAAAQPDELLHLAALAGVSATALRTWAAAWGLGGDAAVTVLADTSSWLTDQDRLEAARTSLTELGLERRSIALNYDSLGMSGNTWLVCGPDGRWYRLTGSNRHGELRLDRPPADDIVDLVDLPNS